MSDDLDWVDDITDEGRGPMLSGEGYKYDDGLVGLLGGSGLADLAVLMLNLLSQLREHIVAKEPPGLELYKALLPNPEPSLDEVIYDFCLPTEFALAYAAHYRILGLLEDSSKCDVDHLVEVLEISLGLISAIAGEGQWFGIKPLDLAATLDKKKQIQAGLDEIFRRAEASGKSVYFPFKDEDDE